MDNNQKGERFDWKISDFAFVTLETVFLFSILKNREHNVLKEQLLIVFTYFLKYVLKIIIQTSKMIKNKTLDLKIISNLYLKILKTC